VIRLCSMGPAFRRERPRYLVRNQPTYSVGSQKASSREESGKPGVAYTKKREDEKWKSLSPFCYDSRNLVHVEAKIKRGTNGLVRDRTLSGVEEMWDA